MTAPFALAQNLSLLSALIIGIFFGLFLERGGLGDPHKLTGVFYLTDFTVPKVMFTAIVVAAAGLYALSDFGLIAMGRVWIVPTFFWPQIVGGAIFGVGFVVCGYCPGTAVAGFASGRMDALVTLAGITAGSLVFAVVYPYIEAFYISSSMGKTVLPAIFKAGHWVVIAVLAGLAVAMFLLMEIFEKRSRGL
ncbi:MAG: YeeE/YedE thiosulfate transporter family protein [Candidatus Sulfobium sp.]